MRALKNVRQHLRSYHLKSGVFHFYRAEHGPAAEHLTRALEEDPTELSPGDRRAALYYLVQTRIGAATDFETQGEMERAIEEYSKALEVMPRYPDVQLRLGDALVRCQRSDEAITHYLEALAVNPLYVQARIRLGFAFLESDKAGLASESFREAQRAREQVVQGRLDAAERALADNEVATARDLYKDAFHEDLSLFQQLFDKGMSHLRNEAWEDAIETFREATALCPRFADVHNYLGVALAENGLYEEAIPSFRVSVQINPEYLVAWLNLAYAAWEADDLESTREGLAQVLCREEDNAPALHLKAELEATIEGRNSGSRRRVPGSAQGKP